MEHEDVMEDASVTANDHVDVDVEVNDEDSDDPVEEIDPDSQGVESTSTKKRKTRTLKSEVWQWFTIIKKKPNDTGPSVCVCNKCGQKYKAGSDQGTGNLKRHHKKCEKEKNRDIGQYMIASNSGVIDMRNPKFSQAKFRELLIEEFDEYDNDDLGSTTTTQLQVYLLEPRAKRTSHIHMLDFWKAQQYRYPELAKLAMDILCVPVSTVASESAFSFGGRILNAYRSSMTSDTVEAIVCTRDWLFGEKFDLNDAVDNLTKSVISFNINENNTEATNSNKP
ncbi:hypothetical protein LXL04_027683 [Taraxacum kok-saghyz]